MVRNEVPLAKHPAQSQPLIRTDAARSDRQRGIIGADHMPPGLGALATIPAVCLSGNLNSTLIERQTGSPHSRTPAGARDGLHAVRAKPSPCPARSAEIRDCEGRCCRLTSWSCGSGRA